jgi:hypothetical protein
MDDYHFTREALEALDGKVLPITVDVGGGKKRTVGVGTLHMENGTLHMAGEISDPAVVKLFKDDPAFKFGKDAPDGR